MRRMAWCLAAGLCAGFLHAAAFGGECIAVSGDGSVLVSGGQQRVIYQHDPATLKVIRRTRVNEQIRDLAFRQQNTLHVMSMKNGEEVQKLELPKETAFLVAIHPDGKRVAVITKSVRFDAPKETAAPPPTPGAKPKPPKEGSVLYLYDIPTGKQTARMHLNFAEHMFPRPVVGFSGDDVIVMTYTNHNVRIAPDGTLTEFKHCSNGLGYGMAISPDGRTLAAGSMFASLLGGDLIDVTTNKHRTITHAQPNPGWPEYYDRMVFDLNGNLYGLTTALRIFRIDADCKMTPIEPVN